MAYAALVSLLQTTDQMLNFDPYFIHFPTEKQIVSFQETVGSLIDFLDHCSPISSSIPEINSLVTKIRDASYEAEDAFESLVANHFRGNSESNAYGLFETSPQRLEKVMEEIDSLKKEVKRVDDGSDKMIEQRISSLDASSRSIPSGTKTFVTLNDDLMMEIMEQLVGESSKLEMIPIVGMGGIGKTTLARTVFTSQLIIESFEICAWVTISQEYRVQEVVLGLLNDIEMVQFKENIHAKKEDLELRLYQILCGRKYLIVLDDVWNNQIWDDIKMLFPDNNCSSRIMLTTRHSEVASYANSDRPYHEMQLLKEDVGWHLFCQIMFRQEDCPPELEKIGKEIVKNCNGLPLAISVIGGLLSKENMTKKYWGYVAQNVNSILMSNDDQCLEILSLSYKYLPHRLKACFLYFGVFPEDYIIRVSRLVELWVAEGFVKPVSSKSMEELGHEYLKDLIHRNLILVHQYGSFRKPKTCSIHDLLRDICIREAQKEKFLYVFNSHVSHHVEANSQRRLSIHPSVIFEDGSSSDEDSDSYSDTLTDGDQSRSCYGIEAQSLSVHPSVIFEDGSSSEEDGGSYAHTSTDDDQSLSQYGIEAVCKVMESIPLIRSFICTAKYPSKTTLKIGSGLVKVLDVHKEYKQFPVEILELVNLRYLELDNVNDQIPSSISRLWNLQTFNAYYFQIFKPLHFEFWDMRQLRHLRLKYFSLPDAEYKGTEPCVLNSLQTLSGIMNLRCTELVLPRIPNLRKLGITYTNFNRTFDWSFYCINNLVNLFELESLNLAFCIVPNETLYKNLDFPSSLKKLVLEGCRIPWEHLTILGMLPNLEVLKLRHKACKGLVWELNEGEFNNLQYLLIHRPDGLVEWRAESSHFPRLQHLIIRKCYDLETIPLGIAEIPTLEVVELYECSPAADASAKEILGEDNDIKLTIHPRQESDAASTLSFGLSDDNTDFDDESANDNNSCPVTDDTL